MYEENFDSCMLRTWVTAEVFNLERRNITGEGHHDPFRSTDVRNSQRTSVHYSFMEKGYDFEMFGNFIDVGRAVIDRS